jgi:hypothetical protein
MTGWWLPRANAGSNQENNHITRVRQGVIHKARFCINDGDLSQYAWISIEAWSLLDLDLSSQFRATGSLSSDRWLHSLSWILTIVWARKLEGTYDKTSACWDTGSCRKFSSRLFLVQRCLVNRNCWSDQWIGIPHLLKILRFSLRSILGDFGEWDCRLALFSTPWKFRAFSSDWAFEIAHLPIVINRHERTFIRHQHVRLAFWYALPIA